MRITSSVCAIALLIGSALLASGPVGAQRASIDSALEEASNHRAYLRVADAEAAYQRALGLGPEDPRVLATYANFKRTTGEYAAAIRLFQKALESGAEEQSLLYQLGIVHRYAKDYDTAATLHRRFIGLNPAVPTGYLQLAYTEIVRGNPDEALRQLQVAEQLFGDELNSWRAAQLAFNYAQLGHRDEVLRLLSQLEQMDTVSQAAWAMAYVALGDYEQALQSLDEATRNPETIGGATNILYQLAANPFSDPALGGPHFQEIFGRLWGT